jgi:putative addiction module component
MQNHMSALFDELEKQARLLTPQEKATLARILIEELDPTADRQVEQLWIAEAQRRYDAYLRGEMESVPGAEVMSRARTRLK